MGGVEGKVRRGEGGTEGAAQCRPEELALCAGGVPRSLPVPTYDEVVSRVGGGEVQRQLVRLIIMGHVYCYNKPWVGGSRGEVDARDMRIEAALWDVHGG